MKKTENRNIIKKLTTIIFCLIAIILIVVGFVGIYVPSQGKSIDLVPEYTLGTDLYGVMEYRFSPDDSEEEKQVYVDDNGMIKGEVIENTDTTETEDETLNVPYNVETRIIKANEEKNLTKNNFEIVNEIITKRFQKFGIVDYAIRMDNITGNTVVELSRKNERDWSTLLIGDSQVQLSKPLYMFDGNFTIKDSQTGVILLDNSYINNVYSEAIQSSETGYVVYLQIEFNEEGTKILNDISKKYIKYTTAEGTSQVDYVTIAIDDLNLVTTYFPEEYDRQILSISVSSELTDNADIKNYAETANMLAEIINIGKLPVTFETNSQLFIKSLIGDNVLPTILVIMYIVLVVILIILTIKFKLYGFIAGILNAGLIALITIVLRFLEVSISISSLISLFVAIGLNIVFLCIYLLGKKDDTGFLEAFKKYYAIIIPVIIISFTFTFFSNEAISGIGNILFWALLIQVIYNFIFIRFAINDK